jgi:class 3 adenylate cyclase
MAEGAPESGVRSALAAALEQSRRHARQLELLNEVARIATQGLELQPMLQRITDALSRVFNWEFVSCMTIDPAGNRFVVRAVSSRLPTEICVGYSRVLGSGVVGEVAMTGRPLLIDDTRQHRNYVETLPGARSELCVPVKSGDRVVAVLNLESTRPAEFHDQLPLFQTVAEQVAGAIDSAHLYEEVRQRAAQLEMMSEVSRTALEAGELQALLQRITDYVHRRMGVEITGILLLDEKGTHLQLAAYTGSVPPPSVAAGAHWPVSRGIIGRAARRGKRQLVFDVASDPDYASTAPGIVAELAVPIRFQDKTLGVMNFEATAAEHLSPERVMVLQTFVDQTAGAIHLAAVNRRLEEANRTLTDLFSRYVAPDLAQVLLADPEKFHSRGERRDATVVIADIRGFTRMSQRVDSERLLSLLNEFNATMADAVFARRGSINRFLGDGFLAVFGVPEAIPDHAVAAVQAALEMQRRADSLSPRWHEATGEPLRLVVAANSGPVIAGTLGDPRHLEFTVLGDVVNVASRLEAEAKSRDARILVTGALRSLLPDGVEARYLGETELRGREGAVALYQVL